MYFKKKLMTVMSVKDVQKENVCKQKESYAIFCKYYEFEIFSRLFNLIKSEKMYWTN